MTGSPPRIKHIPERTCIACRRKGPQDEFVRLTRTSTGWELTRGERTGRGAYVCANRPACWEEKRLKRALGASAASIAEALRPSAPHDSGTPMKTT